MTARKPCEAGASWRTELSPTGDAMFDVRLGGLVSYRAIKVPPSQFDLTLLRTTAGQ